MALRIRSARPGDLPQIYDVLNAAFDTPIELFMAQTERDSTCRWRHARVAEVDGRIVAHVRVFARTMLVRGAPVRAGGIGSVATLPQHEGSGYATVLLYDAIQEMHRLGMVVAYLFTDRVSFYERVGFRVVEQPGFRVRPQEAAATPVDGIYAIRPVEPDDVASLLRIYRTATVGTSGAIVRTESIWRDAQTWLGEDHAGCVVAERAGRPVAYLRARSRPDDYQILEGEHMPGHDPAIAPLLATAGRRAKALRAPLVASVPGDHALATALRSLPSTTWSTGIDHVAHPMMMRVVSLDRLLDALLPQIRDRARTHRGEPFSLTLHAPDGEQATLAVSGASVSIRRRNGAYALDEAGTLAALLGQRRATKLVRPRPPADAARRIDSLFRQAPLHFWNSDRI
ncbi:MAG: GNAT family N-acetyltransferase [Dehalococcoidia bacterium]